nr:aromatic hydrocarbon degradation protein [Gammaproteobacteria bacterium]NIR92557.1 aromatic hydrocarbon degradation protein [Gammaproteobacteria bacterium]
MNPLFPAIVENHYMAGFGYAFNQASDLNFSLTYAPEVSVTNTNTQVGITH